MSLKKNKHYLETRLYGFIFVPLLSCVLAACNGGGGGGSSSDSSGENSPPVPPSTVVGIAVPAKPDNNASVLQCPTTSPYSLASPPAQSSGSIVGRITYERVPFSAQPGEGLDYNHQSSLPARGVVVEALKANDDNQCGTTVVATTLSDGDGWYRLNSGASKVCVRVRAQLYRVTEGGSAANWNFAVADNTAGNALYATIESAPSDADTQPRRDLHAASGWSGGNYTAARDAAPFAILDTACRTMNAVFASRSNTQFGALTFLWSVNNTSDTNGTLEQGKIGGAFFNSNKRAIYLRGDAAVNTDEFDEMVVAHEFGHFVLHVLSRSDSIGGDHSLLDTLDPRLAFDEGWATAFAGLALDDPIYRDSDEVTTVNNQSREFSFDIRTRYSNPPTGWFSESSIQRALYALGSDVADGGTGMGLGALLQTFAGSYRQTDALASIFSYGEFLKNEQSSYASAVAAVLNLEQINGDTITAFATTETHALSSFDLPVYTALDASGTKQRVCSSNAYGTENTLSNRRYLKFTPAQSARYHFTIDPITNGVAGVELLDRGSTIVYVEGTSPGTNLIASSGTLQSGRSYVLGVFHIGNVVKNTTVASGDKCFDVWAQAF